MPERMNKKFDKVDSEEVQGEGSWIVIRNPGFELFKNSNVGNIKEAEDNAELGYQAAKSLLYEWNWVDDEDNPLPQPKDNRDVFDELTIEEQWFIIQAAKLDRIGDIVEDQKN